MCYELFCFARPCISNDYVCFIIGPQVVIKLNYQIVKFIATLHVNFYPDLTLLIPCLYLLLHNENYI